MKKEYIRPVIETDMFDVESVVTSSSNKAKVFDELKASLSKSGTSGSIATSKYDF